ncbi:hypothetical protein [Pseudomonas gingeri]|uniref:hypothetical protein n=1 Tax=Pseudomonas gingeri TaxID=117681 RepID=UPI0015A21100|nr:hypothetical protein [Pseudomonas gingeri]NWE46313.1 hypothetical protein [Pseudomonas gingeri]
MMTLQNVAAVLFLFLNFLSIGLLIYLVNTKLDRAEAYFKDNGMMIGHHRWWGGNSYRSRIMRVYFVGSFFVFSKHYIRRGWLTEQELKPIPISLKRWFKLPQYLGILLVLPCVFHLVVPVTAD